MIPKKTNPRDGMNDDRVSFKLEGNVSIDDFATAVSAFKDLIEAITSDADPTASVSWVLSEAAGGSFEGEFTGVAENPGSKQALDTAIGEYGRLAEEASHGRDLKDFSPYVRRPFYALTSVINGHISGVRLKTSKSEGVAKVRYVQPEEDDLTMVLEQTPDRPQSYVRGSLRGKVSLLSFKGRDYFTLSQPHGGVDVCCYLSDSEYADTIEKYSRKWVMVEGTIRRDTYTGSPKAITKITRIVPFPMFDEKALDRAIGSLPSGNGGDLESHG